MNKSKFLEVTGYSLLWGWICGMFIIVSWYNGNTLSESIIALLSLTALFAPIVLGIYFIKKSIDIK